MDTKLAGRFQHCWLPQTLWRSCKRAHTGGHTCRDLQTLQKPGLRYPPRHSFHHIPHQTIIANLNLTLSTLHALVLCRTHLPPPCPISSTARAFVPISPHAADHATTYPPAFTVPSFAQHIEPGTFMVTPDLTYTHSPNTLTPPLSTEGQEAWVPPPNSINCGQAGFPPMMAFGTTSVFKTEKSVIAS